MSKHKSFSQELLVSKPEPSFTNLVLPPGKRNIRRKLKITSKVEKTNEPVWAPCGSSRERNITVYEEKSQYVRKRMNWDKDTLPF